MLRNYLLIAWKVFQRRKLFTAISLFGISLTLLVLMIAVSVTVSFLYPDGPEKNSENYLTFSNLTLTNDERTAIVSSRPGFRFIENNVLRMKTPEKIGLATDANKMDTYIDNQKVELFVKHTDHFFWEILDFDFIEGRPFSEAEVSQGAQAVVIDQQTAVNFFGSDSALGKDFDVGDRKFEVIGVVDNVAQNADLAFANVWMPYTSSSSTNYRQFDSGNFIAILYHSDASMKAAIKKELINIMQNDLNLSRDEGFTQAFGGAFTKFETISRQVFAGDLELSYESGAEVLALVIIAAVLLFMALPSINLINLNMSRIYERASEIGVRKSFGASTRQLVTQFVVENIALTFVGGMIGMLLSIVMLNAFEQSGFIPYASFDFSLRAFLYGMVLILLFGIMSGFYPALKMSKLDPVDSLKRG